MYVTHESLFDLLPCRRVHESPYGFYLCGLSDRGAESLDVSQNISVLWGVNAAVSGVRIDFLKDFMIV